MEGKAVLKLRSPEKDNIQHLYHENYEVVFCEYVLNKPQDRHGNVNGGIRGGNITLALPLLPSDDLMTWVLDASKKYNGEITIHDAFSESLDKIYFEGARPVGFRLHYEPSDIHPVMIVLNISVQKLIVGQSEHFVS